MFIICIFKFTTDLLHTPKYNVYMYTSVKPLLKCNFYNIFTLCLLLQTVEELFQIIPFQVIHVIVVEIFSLKITVHVFMSGDFI